MLDTTLSFDTLSRVDSSARFGFGPYTQVLASLSGPTEVRLAAEQPSQATLDVNVRPISNVPGTESKFHAAKLAEVVRAGVILESNPRTLVQLVVQILVPTKDGNNGLGKDEIMASMINACTLALLHAGSIPMRGVICAVAIGRIVSATGEASYVVDPKNTNGLEAGGCFAFLFTDSSSSRTAPCIWTNWRSFDRSRSSEFVEDFIAQARSSARDAAREVWERMKGLVEEGEMQKPAPEKRVKLKAKKGKSGTEKMSVDGLAGDDDEAKMEI